MLVNKPPATCLLCYSFPRKGADCSKKVDFDIWGSPSGIAMGSSKEIERLKLLLRQHKWVFLKIRFRNLDTLACQKNKKNHSRDRIMISNPVTKYFSGEKIWVDLFGMINRIYYYNQHLVYGIEF